MMFPVRCPSRNLFHLCSVLSFAFGVFPQAQNQALAQNFTCADPSLVTIAEQARDRSAAFWLGTPLSARWSAPCPIQVNSLAGPGWGNTQFTFWQGEVFGWRMQVSGTQNAIADSVLPHEVDHMVRATLTRRPIVRWLDEGCASLFESRQSHQRLREAAVAIDPSILTADWLDATNYPPTLSDRNSLYAVGFVLTEFLLDRATPKVLLAFQKDPRQPTAKLADYFKLTPVQLQRAWTDWHTARRQLGSSCESVGCLMHCPIVAPAINSEATPELANQLIIWTSRWCGPCRAFWIDWKHDAAFRAAIQAKFQVHVKDVVLCPQLASAHNITSVPTFELAGRRITGYEGAGWLLDQLGLSNEPASTTPEPRSPVGPEKAETRPNATPGKFKTPAPPAAAAPTSRRPKTSEPNKSDSVPSSTELPRHVFNADPFVSAILSVLSLTGLLGGTLATGGLGGIAATLLTVWLRSRITGSTRASPKGSAAPGPAVTRKLDEARQLLALRQSEGGAVPLDALRGMFLADELDKLAQSTEPATVALAKQLKSTINQRIEEVAPLAEGAG